MEKRIRLKSLNPHISCKICRGYLVDATTVTECLHTFCKSCLVKHLEEMNTCPTCEIVIHQSHPLNYISFDRTMQDIVYKLVPNLQQSEMKREREFYRRRGLACPKTNNITNEKDVYSFPSTNNNTINTTTSNGTCKDDNSHSDCHRSDEQVNIQLESQHTGGMKQMKRKFIRCSAQATVTHLKKFVAKKLYNNLEKYKDVEILCNEETLGKDHTLKFVCVTRWRFKESPIKLSYRPKIDF